NFLLQNTGGKQIQYRKRFGYELFSTNQNDEFNTVVNKLADLNKLLKESGNWDNYFKPHAKTYGNFAHTIQFEQECQINPAAAVDALKRVFVNLGGFYLNAVKAEKFEKSLNGYQITTNIGDFVSEQ